ncbi:hypothetical protein BFR04_02815 [Gaetbulibacter sp. 4G1]|nr:hypothetical protein [Gaetbulibacter sp. 4G1]PIA78483.1 hypothetical protein BFR04_02815 [Gaetbulibacter sp. 4G1]
MEKIYFESINRHYLSLLIFIPIAILLLLTNENLDWYIYLIVFILAEIIGLFSPFIFTNYIRYNKEAIFIRFNSLKGHHIKIKDIKKIIFINSCLIIRLYSGNSFVFNTKNIGDHSITTLENLFERIMPKETKEHYCQQII